MLCWLLFSETSPYIISLIDGIISLVCGLSILRYELVPGVGAASTVQWLLTICSTLLCSMSVSPHRMISMLDHFDNTRYSTSTFTNAVIASFIFTCININKGVLTKVEEARHDIRSHYLSGKLPGASAREARDTYHSPLHLKQFYLLS